MNEVLHYLQSNNRHYYTLKELSNNLNLHKDLVESYLKSLLEQNKIKYFRFDGLMYYKIM